MSRGQNNQFARCLLLPACSCLCPCLCTARCLSISVWTYCRARPAWLFGLPFPQLPVPAASCFQAQAATVLCFMPHATCLHPLRLFYAIRCNNKNNNIWQKWPVGRAVNKREGRGSSVLPPAGQRKHMSLSSLTLCQVPAQLKITRKTSLLSCLHLLLTLLLTPALYLTLSVTLLLCLSHSSRLPLCLI